MISFIYAACSSAQEPLPKLAFTVLERLVVCGLGQLLTAALTALRFTKQKPKNTRSYLRTWWNAIWPSVLLHGSSNFIAMSASTLEGNVGWIHPRSAWITGPMIVGVLSVQAVGARLVRGEWRAMEHKARKGEYSTRGEVRFQRFDVRSVATRSCGGC